MQSRTLLCSGVLGALSSAVFGFAEASRPSPASATAALCERAAVEASGSVGAPLELLRAVSLVESRRKVDGEARPWPWTVNTRGEGFWFDTRAEAENFVRREIAQGNRSIDIGCFQVNTRWHGDAFSSPEAMFDPQTNARYAAQFLSALKDETGGWSEAVGLYHSRTPSLRDAYAARIEKMLARLEPLPVERAAPQVVLTAEHAPGLVESVPLLDPRAGAVAMRVASLFASSAQQPLISRDGRGPLFARHKPLLGGAQ